MNKKEREFDELVSRVLLVELGIFLVIIGFFISLKSIFMGWAEALLPLSVYLIGFIFLCLGVFLNKQRVTKTAEGVGSHEVMLLFIVPAFGLCALIRHFSKKDN